MSWAIVYFKKILDHLAKNTGAVTIITTFIAWLTGTIPALITSAVTSITNALASFNIEAFSNSNFAGLDFIGYVNAVFPLSEFVYLCGIYVTAWVVIIGLRWLKSFVPTIGN